jgi:hypothetical protein
MDPNLLNPKEIQAYCTCKRKRQVGPGMYPAAQNSGTGGTVQLRKAGANCPALGRRAERELVRLCSKTLFDQRVTSLKTWQVFAAKGCDDK